MVMAGERSRRSQKFVLLLPVPAKDQVAMPHDLSMREQPVGRREL